VRLTLVVAAAENGVIGRDGALPWHLPADLKHFKRSTMGKPILMGRKTHQSIGRALPGRLNLVLTRQPDYRAPGCELVRSLDEALVRAERDGARELMIIGGAGLYREALSRADRILLTRVHGHFEGDTRFPELDAEAWTEVCRQRREADAANPAAMSFIELVRRPAVPDRSLQGAAPPG
jgi:dihydrofolate reductase